MNYLSTILRMVTLNDYYRTRQRTLPRILQENQFSDSRSRAMR